jgi:hypothetical protein
MIKRTVGQWGRTWLSHIYYLICKLISRYIYSKTLSNLSKKVI